MTINEGSLDFEFNKGYNKGRKDERERILKIIDEENIKYYGYINVEYLKERIKEKQ